MIDLSEKLKFLCVSKIGLNSMGQKIALDPMVLFSEHKKCYRTQLHLRNSKSNGVFPNADNDRNERF